MKNHNFWKVNREYNIENVDCIPYLYMLCTLMPLFIHNILERIIFLVDLLINEALRPSLASGITVISGINGSNVSSWSSRDGLIVQFLNDIVHFFWIIS